MAAWFDNVINYGVPIGIVLWIIFLFYVKFKETFDAMFGTLAKWVGGAFGAMSGKTKDIADSSYETIYTYGR